MNSNVKNPLSHMNRISDNNNVWDVIDLNSLTNPTSNSE